MQSQNRVLTEQLRDQLAEIENLKIHTRHVEDQLIQAEEDLARQEQHSGRQRLAGGQLPQGVSGRLAELSSRYPSLQYDQANGVSKLDTDLLFDSGDADLKPGSDRVLNEFAEIFQSPEGRDLKIMVIGHADALGIKGREVRQRVSEQLASDAGRALAVADRLCKAGIPQDRMGVVGFGEHQPISSNESPETRQKNRRVEIYVLGPETPVIGWADTPNRMLR